MCFQEGPPGVAPVGRGQPAAGLSPRGAEPTEIVQLCPTPLLPGHLCTVQHLVRAHHRCQSPSVRFSTWPEHTTAFRAPLCGSAPGQSTTLTVRAPRCGSAPGQSTPPLSEHLGMVQHLDRAQHRCQSTSVRFSTWTEHTIARAPGMVHLARAHHCQSTSVWFTWPEHNPDCQSTSVRFSTWPEHTIARATRQ